MKRIALFAAALVAGFSSTALAAGVIYGSTPGYLVMQNQADKHCAMMSTKAKNWSYALLYRPLSGEAFLSARINDGANFSPGTKQDLRIVLWNGEVKDGGWGTKPFTVDAPNGDAEVRSFLFGPTTDGETLLWDFGANTMFALISPSERIVFGYDLTGSKAAINMLKECAYGIRAE